MGCVSSPVRELVASSEDERSLLRQRGGVPNEQPGEFLLTGLFSTTFTIFNREKVGNESPYNANKLVLDRF